VQLEPADAHHLCSIASRKWRPVLSEAGIEFSVELPSGLLMVMADRLYLPRLLNIVLENAGGVRLSLTAEGERARFEVADIGVGIPRQGRAQIFDRFYRAASVRAARIPSFGLGLSLAAWIACPPSNEDRRCE